MTNINATSTGLPLGAISPQLSWIITIGIFLSVLGIIFILSKNFRDFIYGSVISGILLLNFKFSSWVGASAAKDNLAPLKWTFYAICFIIGSVLIGKATKRLKFVKNIERYIDEHCKT